MTVLFSVIYSIGYDKVLSKTLQYLSSRRNIRIVDGCSASMRITIKNNGRARSHAHTLEPAAKAAPHKNLNKL